jgi:hypothetical protein
MNEDKIKFLSEQLSLTRFVMFCFAMGIFASLWGYAWIEEFIVSSWTRRPALQSTIAFAIMCGMGLFLSGMYYIGTAIDLEKLQK